MTFLIILFLSIIIAVLSEYNLISHVPSGIMYKGERFYMKDYPYIMLVKSWKVPKRDYGPYATCTGSLVRKMFVLTAGHCCVGIKDIDVYQGTSETDTPNMRTVEKIYNHEDYHFDNNDVCVLKLEKEFSNIKTYMKIGFSGKDFANQKRVRCTLFGFGITGDEKRDGMLGYMMESDFRNGPTACIEPRQERIRKRWKQYMCMVRETESIPCVGDSGGPMVCNNLQYGICSFLYVYEGNSTACGGPNTQEVYMSTVYHGDWIKKIIGPDEEKKKKKKKKKRNSGILLKPHHYTLYITLSVLFCNMLTSI